VGGALERFGGNDDLTTDCVDAPLSLSASDAADNATPTELAWLVEVWGSLPEDVRADVLATMTAALSETVAGPS